MAREPEWDDTTRLLAVLMRISATLDEINAKLGDEDDADGEEETES